MRNKKYFNVENLTEIHTLYINYDELLNMIIDEERKNIDYSRIGLMYKKLRINLSHIMYKKVIKKTYGNKGAKYFVDLKTFNTKNSKIIDDLIKMLCQHNICNQVKNINYIKNIISSVLYFISWINEQSKDYPITLEEGINCFIEYKIYLRSLIKNNLIVSTTAHFRSVWALKLLEISVNDNEGIISKDINIIKGKEIKNNDFSITTKSQKEFEYVFAFYYNFFNQISDFLLEKRSYPYSISLPRGPATIIPSLKAKVIPSYQEYGSNNIAIDHFDGHILNDDEIELITSELKGKKRWSKKSTIKVARNKLLILLSKVNEQFNHEYRLSLSKRAMDAWYMIMLAITGINESSLGKLKWNNEFYIVRDEYNFLAIKSRANNKKVFFKIRKGFKKAFEKFLKLREFALNGYSCEYLFFGGYSKNSKIVQNQIQGSRAAEIYKTFLSIDNKLPHILSRDFRKDYGNDFSKTKGLIVASIALQHNLSIHLKYYSGETNQEKAKQIENFFASVHTTVTNDINKDIPKTAAGNCDCTEELTPEIIEQNVEIEPECMDQKSCLWCVHYKIHNNEEDIRKLMSVKYIVTEISLSRAENKEHYKKVINPWLNRIETICKEMISLDSNSKLLINKIWKEVKYEGKLTSYWLRWLDLLDELGVLK